MSEEEKKAIEVIKQEIDRYKAIEMPKGVYITDIKMLLSTVKEQQEEMEELKERNKELVESIEEWINGERINDIKHISKDRIREKIKELNEVLEEK